MGDPKRLRRWLREMEAQMEKAPTYTEASKMKHSELQKKLNEQSVSFRFLFFIIRFLQIHFLSNCIHLNIRRAKLCSNLKQFHLDLFVILLDCYTLIINVLYSRILIHCSDKTIVFNTARSHLTSVSVSHQWNKSETAIKKTTITTSLSPSFTRKKCILEPLEMGN